jgi:CheY-like chemotaxis protein
MPDKQVQILLVEDDEVDVDFLLRAFVKANIANKITVARDGYEALEILNGKGGHQRLPRPYIILLDINMPRMNGLEFLHVLRQDAELGSSVVFMLTTSNAQKDMLAAYDEHVAGYFLKQNIGTEFLALPNLLANYWRVVEFPVSR